MSFSDRLLQHDTAPFIEELKKVFEQMDKAYDHVAQAYGFHCRGCTDNCCFSRFYHHTLLEYIYLRQGLSSLDHKLRETVLSRARHVVAANQEEDRTGIPRKVLCPLNKDGLCLIYTNRPMVCRLHGLSHELCKPNQSSVKSPGCRLFEEKTGEMEYIPFDRTPHYASMARLERNIRLSTGIKDRLKHTIAEMLLL